MRTQIVRQHDAYQAQQEQYTAALTSRASEIERLTLLVEKLQRMLFGTRSEKVLRQIEQLELQLEELQAANAVEEQTSASPAERPVAAKPFRRPLAGHLPREVHTHMPDHAACPGCGGKLRELGEDVAEMLEYVRSCFKVIRHVRPKLSCEACDRIVQGWAWLAGACSGGEICQSLAALPAVGDLRPRGRRSRPLHAGRLDRRDQ